MGIILRNVIILIMEGGIISMMRMWVRVGWGKSGQVILLICCFMQRRDENYDFLLKIIIIDAKQII